jgi:hypothetical protein
VAGRYEGPQRKGNHQHPFNPFEISLHKTPYVFYGQPKQKQKRQKHSLFNIPPLHQKFTIKKSWTELTYSGKLTKKDLSEESVA